MNWVASKVEKRRAIAGKDAPRYGQDKATVNDPQERHHQVGRALQADAHAAARRHAEGGQVVGQSDERGAQVAERLVTMGDLYATLYKALGIDWHKEYPTPIGRPVKIANSVGDRTGEPIRELI